MSSLATRAAAVWGSGLVRRRRPATGPSAPRTASMTAGALLTNNARASCMDRLLGFEKHAPASQPRPRRGRCGAARPGCGRNQLLSVRESVLAVQGLTAREAPAAL